MKNTNKFFLLKYFIPAHQAPPLLGPQKKSCLMVDSQSRHRLIRDRKWKWILKGRVSYVAINLNLWKISISKKMVDIWKKSGKKHFLAIFFKNNFVCKIEVNYHTEHFKECNELCFIKIDWVVPNINSPPVEKKYDLEKNAFKVSLNTHHTLFHKNST